MAKREATNQFDELLYQPILKKPRISRTFEEDEPIELFPDEPQKQKRTPAQLAAAQKGARIRKEKNLLKSPPTASVPTPTKQPATKRRGPLPVKERAKSLTVEEMLALPDSSSRTAMFKHVEQAPGFNKYLEAKATSTQISPPKKPAISLSKSKQEKLRGLGQELVEEFGFSASETKKLPGILEKYQDIIQYELSESSFKIRKNVKKKKIELGEAAGLKWETIFVPSIKKCVLVAYLDLEIFLPWLLQQKYWKDLFPTPNDVLVLAYDPDGFPTYRWAQDKKNGFFNVAMKIVNNPHLTDSSLLCIPMLSYHGPEEYEYLEPLTSFFMKKLADLKEIVVGGKRLSIISKGVGDMASRVKMYQMGSISGAFPLTSLPLHKEQYGDVSLWPRSFHPRYSTQLRLVESSKGLTEDKKVQSVKLLIIYTFRKCYSINILE